MSSFESVVSLDSFHGCFVKSLSLSLFLYTAHWIPVGCNSWNGKNGHGDFNYQTQPSFPGLLSWRARKPGMGLVRYGSEDAEWTTLRGRAGATAGARARGPCSARGQRSRANHSVVYRSSSMARATFLAVWPALLPSSCSTDRRLSLSAARP